MTASCGLVDEFRNMPPWILSTAVTNLVERTWRSTSRRSWACPSVAGATGRSSSAPKVGLGSSAPPPAAWRGIAGSNRHRRLRCATTSDAERPGTAGAAPAMAPDHWGIEVQTTVYGGSALSRRGGLHNGSSSRPAHTFAEVLAGPPAEYFAPSRSPHSAGMSVLAPAARVGPHCKLRSFASMVARARHRRPEPAQPRRCACWSCGCRYPTYAPAAVCDTCSGGLHCTNASAIPAESAVSVRAALAFGDWRLWSAPRCERCLEPLPAGDVARLYHVGDHPPLTGHRTPAACVDAALGDVARLLRVLRRLQLFVAVADRKGLLA